MERRNAVIDLPYFEEVLEELKSLRRDINNLSNGWMTTKQFCKNFDISDSTLRLWRKEGTIISKKIGKVVFVNLVKTLEK